MRGTRLLGIGVGTAVALVAGVLAPAPPVGASAATDPPPAGFTTGHLVGASAPGGAGADDTGTRDTRRAGAPTGRRVVLDDWDPTVSPPSAQRRMQRVSVTQDLASGKLTAVVAFAAAPTQAQESVIEVYVGHWDGGNCRMDAAILASAWAPSQTHGVWADETELSVSRSRSDTQVTLRTTSHADRIKSTDWECGFTRLRSPDATTVYQSSYAEGMSQLFAPRLKIRAGEPIQGDYAGRSVDLRVEVANLSEGDAPGVVLKASGRGLAIKRPRRSLGLIESRSAEYGLIYRVRLKGAKARTLTFRATTEGKAFTRKIRIVRTPRPRTYPSLAGRYFWGHAPVSTSEGWDNRAAWFLDRKWVHLGFPKNGATPKCRKVSKKCQRYRYDKRTGKVTFGGRSAKVDSEGFVHKRIRYYPTAQARKGQRFSLSLLRNDFVGNCVLSCTTWTEWLVMTKQGRFVLTRQTIGSIGGPGAGTIWGSVGPDQKGTYRVISPSRIELRYIDGDRQRHRFDIEYDAAGRPNPSVGGVVLGDRNFYWDE